MPASLRNSAMRTPSCLKKPDRLGSSTHPKMNSSWKPYDNPCFYVFVRCNVLDLLCACRVSQRKN